MITVSNEEFIRAIFGKDADRCHVTDFPYDPGNIPSDRHLSAWKGDYFSRYEFTEGSNQYFTISTFDADERGIARRRKALYRQTHCLVLDDVKEKLSAEEAKKLPEPSWIMETSPGSEQHGYILTEPCTVAARIDNLNDGLIASALAPQGKDPGQKGTTRYVRLPEGYNNKASKLVDGQPFKCRMLAWNPFNCVTLEQLAAPFNVNLDAERREQRVDGAAKVDDHPLLQIPDIIHIKEVRSDGRFDITCPWVSDHTGRDDTGTAVFTNDDGTIGFKCHHGACQSRTGGDLLKQIERDVPGFGSRFTGWKMQRAFADLANFDTPVVAATPVSPSSVDAGPDPLESALNTLRITIPGPQQRNMAAEILKVVDDMPEIERVHWHSNISDIMRWTKTEMMSIIKDLRSAWYVARSADVDFFSDVVFIGELNQFFDRKKRIFYTPEAYHNAYSHLDAEARKEALQGGRVTKVDRVDYAPLKPAVFEVDGVKFANSWFPYDAPAAEGDISPWLRHFGILGWEDDMKHIIQYMAHTIRHPDRKINHVLLLGSGEGSGKDFLLYPLIRAMGHHSKTISGEELLDGFNDYILSTKHLHINETELGDRREAIAVGAKLKPLAAAPPDTLRCNQKGLKQVAVRNILNCTMTTNSQTPLRLNGPSRRFFAVWSDFSPNDRAGQRLPEWARFWDRAWTWMRDEGGVESCIWYLKNVVDLSDFNPGEAPRVTEFLQDIQESSKSPAHATVEAFIENRIGAFSEDVVSSADLSATLVNGPLHPEGCKYMYHDARWFTPTRVGIMLREIRGCFQLRVTKEGKTSRLWVIRDAAKYRGNQAKEINVVNFDKKVG